MTTLMGFWLGKAVANSGGIPDWLVQDRGMVYFAGSYAFGLAWSAWYFNRMRRLQPSLWAATLLLTAQRICSLMTESPY